MTILGRHTIAETLDYIKALDARIEQDNAAYKTIPAAYRAANSDKAAALDKDWAACYKRWKDLAMRVGLSLKAQNAATPLVAPYNIPAESEWQEILAFWEKGKDPGGMRDCEIRITEAIGHPIDYANIPKQNAPDTDIQAIKDLDNDIKKMENAAAAAKKKAGDAAKSNLGLILIGGVVVLGGVVVATKVYL